MKGQTSYGPLSVLVIDKTAVLESVRERWDRLGRVPGIKLGLLVPERWVENYTPMRFTDEGDHAWDAVVGKVLFAGKEASGMYLTGLRRAFRKFRPDIVMMMEESFSMFALQTLITARIHAPRARLIFYSNNVTSYDRFTYRLGPLYKLIGRWVTPGFDAGLCVNDLAVRVLETTGYDVLVRKLFYGINERLFYPRPREEARAGLGLPVNETIFLYAGRFLELKGIQDLIPAFERVCARHPDKNARLLLVGDGDYADALQALAGTNRFSERIEFRRTVPLEQMPSLMSAADAFILPSRKEINEQFGRVNIEAMLCGTTIIGSTSGGIPEAIGDGGFLFEAGDVGQLTDLLESVLVGSDEVERRKELGREQALAGYSTGAFIEGLVKLFEELSGRNLHPVHSSDS